MRHLAPWVALAVFFLGGPLQAEAPSVLTEKLLKLERERFEAYKKGDIGVLQKQFADEIYHVNYRGEVTNRNDELSFYGPANFTLNDAEISEVDVRDYGNVAVMLALVEWKGAAFKPNPTTVIDLSGKFRVTRVYALKGDTWQLASSHASKLP